MAEANIESHGMGYGEETLAKREDYTLMNPLLLLSAIAGGASGVFTFTLMGAGLTAPASPGSILAILAMTPRGGYLPILAGVLVATAVSFAISLPLLKFAGKDEDLEESRKKMTEMKQEAKGVKPADEPPVLKSGAVKKIVFACDAGMGSSAMGATVLRKKLTAAGLGDIEVVHSPVSSIPADAQVVVTHHEPVSYTHLMDAIVKAKPSTLKGAYIKSATLTSTMGPGVKLNVVKLMA